MSKNIGYIKEGVRGKMNKLWVRIGLQPDSHEGLGRWLGLPNGGDHGIYALIALTIIIVTVAYYYFGVVPYSVYIFIMWSAFIGNALFWIALEMWQAHRGNKQGWETNPYYNIFGWNKSRHQDWIMPTILVSFLLLGFHTQYKDYYHDAFVVPTYYLTEGNLTEGNLTEGNLTEENSSGGTERTERIGNYNLTQTQKNIKVCDIYQDDKDYQNCLRLMMPNVSKQHYSIGE